MKKILLIAACLPLAALAADLDTVYFYPPSTTFSSGSESLPAKAHSNKLAAPDTAELEPESAETRYKAGASSETTATRAFGNFTVPYTSKRVSAATTQAVDPNSNAYLSATFPYSAIGKLNFKVYGMDSFCSASVILKGVIVTAAHCMQFYGAGTDHFDSYVFRPASYRGSSPYGEWTPIAAVWSTTWSRGNDVGDGSAVDNDLAVMIVGKNKSEQFISEVVGGHLNYGWNNYSFSKSKKTGNLWTAAVTTLGYPGLLDNGEILQRSDGPTYLTTISEAHQLYQGSNFTGGSSGGPWLVNFGYQNPKFSEGANKGHKAIANVVVGVTSWGTVDPNQPKDNYSSQFTQNKRYPLADYGGFGAGNIAALLNRICAAKPEGSPQTFKQLGYCDQ
ncbi:serine protease [uncultured Thiothrix sp.]|uniref:trypsin-like serine peptidase n=1 Tax=uncultured Thiothrix sp. TaxID=223185 RepID=UPI00261E69ED|nr:trypsin-like serine protease [uncultured Thiothrix sp.]